MSYFKHTFVPALLAAALIFAGSPRSRAYSDAENHWAAEVINKAEAYGLMEGYPDGRFGVGDDMTRAAFVTVLCRMMGWEISENPTLIHRDCEGHWALPYIDAAAQHGIEDNGGLFRPDDPISRFEMAQMLVRALGYDDLAQAISKTDLSLPFADVPENNGYIAIAYDFGIINGVEGPAGTLKFLPSDSAPREQAAAMLVRCYERYFSQMEWRHGFYAFSSYAQLGVADSLDAVSLGWAQLQFVEDKPLLNDTAAYNNDWVKPQGADEATSYLTERSIPYNLNVFASATTFASMEDTAQRQTAISLLVEAAGPYAGLTMDVEGLKTDLREAYSSFMADLRAALPRDKTLYVCVQPDTWFGGFDYRALGEVCDKVILMAHDYQWASIPDYYLGTANTDCPVTPIDKVATALQHITDPRTGVQDKSRLALAISFNTTGFHVDENGLLLDQTFYHPATATIARRLEQEDTVYTWDEQSQNPFIEYATEEGEHYKLWYENAPSVAAKLRLARMYGVSGVSVWRVGMVPTYGEIENYDVWEVLKVKNEKAKGLRRPQAANSNSPAEPDTIIFHFSLP